MHTKECIRLIGISCEQAAVGAYKKAGYTEVSEGDELEKREDEAFESKKCCLLMHKTFEGFFT